MRCTQETIGSKDMASSPSSLSDLKLHCATSTRRLGAGVLAVVQLGAPVHCSSISEIGYRRDHHKNDSEHGHPDAQEVEETHERAAAPRRRS